MKVKHDLQIMGIPELVTISRKTEGIEDRKVGSYMIDKWLMYRR